MPAGALLALAFGTLSADRFESSGHRSPEPTVLFYATNNDSADVGAERLIRKAGFEPVKVGGVDSRIVSRWAATFTIWSFAPQRRSH